MGSISHSASMDIRMYSFLVLMSIFVDVRGQCIEDYECPNAPEDPPMNIEDPADCTSYILCVGGCAIQMKCQDNFLFDTTVDYCNYPELVSCGDRPCEDEEHCQYTTSSTTSTTITTTTTTTTASTTTDTTTPDTTETTATTTSASTASSTTTECQHEFPPHQKCP